MSPLMECRLMAGTDRVVGMDLLKLVLGTLKIFLEACLFSCEFWWFIVNSDQIWKPMLLDEDRLGGHDR